MAKNVGIKDVDVSVPVTPAFREKLRSLRDATGISAAAIARKALEQAVDRHGKGLPIISRSESDNPFAAHLDFTASQWRDLKVLSQVFGYDELGEFLRDVAHTLLMKTQAEIREFLYGEPMRAYEADKKRRA